MDSLASKVPNRNNLHNSDSVDLDKVNSDSTLNNAVSVDLKPIADISADTLKVGSSVLCSKMNSNNQATNLLNII